MGIAFNGDKWSDPGEDFNAGLSDEQLRAMREKHAASIDPYSKQEWGDYRFREFLDSDQFWNIASGSHP